MDLSMIIAIILVVVAIIGLLIVIRPHPVKITKKQTTNSHTNDMHGWGIHE